MGVLQSLTGLLEDHIYIPLFGLPLLFLILRSVYRVFFHPLSHVPGPLLPKLTSAWLNYHAYSGDEATAVHRLHQKYGPVVRTGPRDVDIADGAALIPIYSEKGGFRKPPYYRNFDIDGHISLFSATDPAHRAPRAKAILPLFSTANLRTGSVQIYKCVDQLIERIREESKTGEPVNILNLTRSFAIDAVSTYLFRYSYGGLDEKSLSAAGMVETFVAGNRFFYLPSWLFDRLLTWIPILMPDRKIDESLDKVDKFVKSVVVKSQDEKSMDMHGNYPSRMLEFAGVTDSEAAAQSKDLIFAGGDSTAMNLTTIMFHLSRSPQQLSKLKTELTSEANATLKDPIELQSLPYLRGVVREGLRLSMANPARLGRVVPAEGWWFIPLGTSQHARASDSKTYLTAGTTVSCTPYELHFNPRVFLSPFQFDPERWSEENENEEMRRDFIPFGLGSRQCIARNLATLELFATTAEMVRAGTLEHSRPSDPELADSGRIPILQWFNSKVIGGKIELTWETDVTGKDQI